MNKETIAFIEERIAEAVRASVKETVNGKVDRLSQRIEEHIAAHESDWGEIKPFIQGVVGARLIGSSLKWLAGIAAAWIILRDIVLK